MSKSSLNQIWFLLQGQLSKLIPTYAVTIELQEKPKAAQNSLQTTPCLHASSVELVSSQSIPFHFGPLTCQFSKCRVILLWPLLLALSLLYGIMLKKLSSFLWEFSSNIWRAIRFTSGRLFPMLTNPSTRLISFPFCNQPSKGPWSQLKTNVKSGNNFLAPPVFKLLNFSYGKVQEALEYEECLH